MPVATIKETGPKALLYLKDTMTKQQIMEKFTRLVKVIDQQDGIIFIECPACGKKFAKFTSVGWAYKVGYTSYCSYGCMRKAQTLVESVKAKRGRGRRVID